MAEGDQHIDAVARIKKVLADRGHQIYANSNERGIGGFAFPALVIENVVSPFIADVYAERAGLRFIVEVDGQEPGQGHNSSRAKAGDHRRDQIFWDNFGIPTVRFWTNDLVGKSGRFYEDSLIMKEIAFQIYHWHEFGRPSLK